MTKPFKLVADKGVISRKEYEALDYDDRTVYWQISKNEFRLMSEMNDEHLQKAFYYAQNKELEFHNKYTFFFELLVNFEKVAKERGLKLKDLDTEFHRNKRKYEV